MWQTMPADCCDHRAFADHKQQYHARIVQRQPGIIFFSTANRNLELSREMGVLWASV